MPPGRSNKPLEQTNGALARMVAPFAAQRRCSADTWSSGGAGGTEVLTNRRHRGSVVVPPVMRLGAVHRRPVAHTNDRVPEPGIRQLLPGAGRTCTASDGFGLAPQARWWASGATAFGHGRGNDVEVSAGTMQHWECWAGEQADAADEARVASLGALRS